MLRPRDKYGNNSDSDWYKHRLIGAMFCIMAAFLILIVRLFYLQILEGEEFRRLSANQSIRKQSIDPPRGLIFDRNGILLVDNRPSFDLSIILKDAKPLKKTFTKLSQYIGERPDDLFRKIKEKKHAVSYKPILIKQDIGRNVLASVEVHKFDLPGILVDVKPRRNYIFPYSSSHVLGYLGEINVNELKSGKYPGTRQGDYIGKFGIEKVYEEYLRGKHGGRLVEVNATGQVVRVLKTEDAVPGHNIYLTIDHVLQNKAEVLLEGVVGAVVAMDPATGEILVMASSPSFDQNAFVSGLSHSQWDALVMNPFRPMENKVIQGEYPPASTYKIITAMAALEEGVVDETTTSYCPGFYRYGDRVFRCWKRGGHGTVNLLRALAESCDVYFYQAGQKLGVDRLAWYAKACGLGELTGIRLDQEKKGLIPTASWKKKRTGRPWHRGETLSVAIGQGYDLVTPLQILSVIAAVGNGGIRYQPVLLKKIETADGKIVLRSSTKVAGKLPIQPQNLKLIQKGLRDVVNKEKGTAGIVRLKDVEVSGKTGTGQVFSRKKNAVRSDLGTPDHLKAHAWFVAYAPSVNPKIAVAAIIEHGEHGSSAAGPVVREIIKQYLLNNDLQTQKRDEVK